MHISVVARATLLLTMALAGCGSPPSAPSVLAAPVCPSQPTWTLQFTGPGLYPAPSALAVDPACNVILSAQTGADGALSVDGTPVLPQLNRWLSAKVSADGELRWVTPVGGKVASLSSGDVAILGTSAGPIPTPGGDVNVSDGFVGRLDGETGKAKWIVPLPQGASSLAVAVDADDQIVIAGSFVNTIELDGRTLTTHGDSSTDAFVARFDAGGELLSLRGYGGSQGDAVTALAIDPAGGLFIGGYTDAEPSLGCADCGSWFSRPWLARITAGGDFAWEQRPGRSGTSNQVSSLALDGNRNVLALHTDSVYETLSRWTPDGAMLTSKQFSAWKSSVWSDRAGNVYLQGGIGSYAPNLGGGPIKGDTYAAKLDAELQHVYSTGFFTGDWGGGAGAVDAAGGRWLLIAQQYAFETPIGSVPAPPEEGIPDEDSEGPIEESGALVLMRFAPDSLAGLPK